MKKPALFFVSLAFFACSGGNPTGNRTGTQISVQIQSVSHSAAVPTSNELSAKNDSLKETGRTELQSNSGSDSSFSATTITGVDHAMATP